MLLKKKRAARGKRGSQAEDQWWKRRIPVKDMAMPYSLHASMTPSSCTLPPGCVTKATPCFAACRGFRHRLEGGGGGRSCLVGLRRGVKGSSFGGSGAKPKYKTGSDHQTWSMLSRKGKNASLDRQTFLKDDAHSRHSSLFKDRGQKRQNVN